MMKLKDIIPSANATDFGDADIKTITRFPEYKGENVLFFDIPPHRHPRKNIMPFFTPIAVISENPNYFSRQNIICSENVRADYAKAYRRFCGDVPERLVGITGTNGKSTTALFLKAILEKAFGKVGLVGTGKILSGDTLLSRSDYSMTTPDAEVLYPALSKMQSDGCQVCVMEVSSHALTLERVAPLSFSVGVFTNLSPEHSDFHPSMEDYFSAKAKLFVQSEAAVVGIDNPYGKRLSSMLSKRSFPLFTFGFSSDADFRIENAGEEKIGQTFLLSFPSGSCEVTLKMPGNFNAENAAAAIASAFLFGIPPLLAIEALRDVKVPGRYDVYRSDITVISDYAHTPAAFDNLLKTAKLRAKGALTVVFGCGGRRDAGKRPMTAKTVESYADKVIITDDNPRDEDPESILAQIAAGFKSPEIYRIIRPRESAVKAAISEAKPGETVVIIGKSCEHYQITSEGVFPYDEQKLIVNALKERPCGYTESDDS